MKRLSVEFNVLAMACGLYLVVSIACSILLTLVWQLNLDVTNQNYQALAQQAEQSPFIIIGSAIIGVFTTMLTAAFITFRAKRHVLQLVYFTGLLILYGVLSIVLHPEASMLINVLKVLSPAPLCYFGYLIATQYQQKKQMQSLAAE